MRGWETQWALGTGSSICISDKANAKRNCMAAVLTYVCRSSEPQQVRTVERRTSDVGRWWFGVPCRRVRRKLEAALGSLGGASGGLAKSRRGQVHAGPGKLRTPELRAVVKYVREINEQLVFGKLLQPPASRAQSTLVDGEVHGRSSHVCVGTVWSY